MASHVYRHFVLKNCHTGVTKRCSDCFSLSVAAQTAPAGISLFVYQYTEHFWSLFILLALFSGTTGTNVPSGMSVYASLNKGALAVTCLL